MSVIKILKQQHREMERLLDLILKDQTPAEDCGRLLGQLGDALRVHNALEEDLVYAEALVGRTERMASKAGVEHRVAERLLAELGSADRDDSDLVPKLLVLKDLLLHHVDVEEKEFLPKVEALLGVTRLEELGREFERRSQALRRGETTESGMSATEEASVGHA